MSLEIVKWKKVALVIAFVAFGLTSKATVDVYTSSDPGYIAYASAGGQTVSTTVSCDFLHPIGAFLPGECNGVGCSINSANYDSALANRNADCGGALATLYTASEVDATVLGIQNQIASEIATAKSDFKAHVDTIPVQLIKDGAVLEMKNSLQQQLSDELTVEINRKVEELVRQRMEFLVPQKVAEEVAKQLAERGL